MTTESTDSGTPPSEQPLFISYGRADALQFVRRLSDDLRRHQQGSLWIDLESIAEGEHFDVRIEEGIRQAVAVAAVLTPRSIEADSVCRDEVVYAVNQRKKIVPLRVFADVPLKPSLLLARRNWIDFTQDYEQGLKALLHFISGDESGLRAPELPTVTGVVPLDFGVEIAKFCEGFVGRDWLSHEIDDWLTHHQQPAYVIVAEPGVGKSALAAWLSATRDDVVGVHFCTRQNSRTRDPHEFVANLVAQLSGRLPGFSSALGAKMPELRRPTASDAFRELVVEPTQPPFTTPGQPCLVFVDSLDEAEEQQGETILDVLTRQLCDLPPWLRIVMTTQPKDDILQRVRHFKFLQIDAARNENTTDLGVLVRSRLATGRVAQRQPVDVEAVASSIERLAEGNFLYAELTLAALEDGLFDVADLGNLAPELSVFFADVFRLRFPDLSSFSEQFEPLLGALAVAREPLSFDLLKEICETSSKELHYRLLQIKSLLRETLEGKTSRYAFFHKSLGEWLTDRTLASYYWCDPEEAHCRLATVLVAHLEKRGPAKCDEYVWSGFAFHHYWADQQERLQERVDVTFLEHKFRRHGYAVLEDIQLLTRALLESGDPAFVERCVALVEALREVLGNDITEDVRRQAAFSGGRVPALRSRTVEPEVPTVPGLDIYVGMLPKAEVGADFVEFAPHADGLSITIGDVPASGLKSGFVARFLANLFTAATAKVPPSNIGDVLTQINRTICSHEFFEPTSMQCVDIDSARGIISVASAAHPYPVLFRSHGESIDRLPVRGPLLAAEPELAENDNLFRTRHVEWRSGDMLVLYTDGLNEGDRLQGEAYGDRFHDVIAAHREQSARAIGRGVLEDWRSFPREADDADDVTVVVLRNLT